MKKSLKVLVVCLVCLFPVVSIATATDRQAKVCVVTSYEAQVLGRVGNQEALNLQPSIIAQALAPVDGRMVLQTEGYTLVWNANFGNVTVWQNNQPQVLSYYTDEYGRLAFVGETVNGDIDIFGTEVHLRFQTPASGQTYWTGQLVTTVAEDGTSDTTINMAIRKKCICKGTNSTAGCGGVNDCLNTAPCTNPHGPSNCGMYYPPPVDEVVPEGMPDP